MSFSQYLKTPWNNGSSTAKGYEDHSEVLAWSWGHSAPITVAGGGGGGAGKVAIQALSVTKWVDESTVNIGAALPSGQALSRFDLIQVPGGAPGGFESFRLRMYTVWVESQTFGASGGEDRMTENITLVFERYRALQAQHLPTIGKTRAWGWDQATNTPF